MGRLVDTDILVKIIDKHTNDDNQLDNDITCILEEVPTAYDVEKVVEQIKREQYDIPECSYERGFNAMARFAQKVVRKGGVE